MQNVSNVRDLNETCHRIVRFIVGILQLEKSNSIIHYQKIISQLLN